MASFRVPIHLFEQLLYAPEPCLNTFQPFVHVCQSSGEQYDGLLHRGYTLLHRRHAAFSFRDGLTVAMSRVELP